MAKTTNVVKSRAVFFIGGFDPKSPEAFYGRMDRENGRFEQLWNTKVSRQPFDDGSDDIICSRFETQGNDGGHPWATSTDFHYFALDDIVLKDFSKPLLVRILRYLFSFADYTFTATGMKFIWHSWRFALYVLYPMFMWMVSIALSLVTSAWVGSFESPYATFASVIAFLACLAFCYQFVLKRGFVFHLMDLWSFSTGYIYRRRRDMDAKLDRLADALYQAASNGQYDEILAVGHSTGGALMLDATARVAERYPDYAQYASKVTVLTVGSTALKVGLHPFAGWYRKRLRHLFTTTPTRWMEWQCVTDVINFHKTNPAQLMGFEADMQTKMHIGAIRVKEMIDNDVYQRVKNNYFRVHYQFVYANTRKYIYDFPAICFGPVTVWERVRLEQEMRGDNPYLHSLSGVDEEKT